MDRYDYDTEATGTKWIVSFWSDEFSKEDSQKLWESCVSIIQNFERMYSRFDESSLVTSLHRRTGDIEVPRDMIKMLEIYQTLYTVSNGLVTPLGGEMITELGYDAQYSFQEVQERTNVPLFADVVKIIDDQHISILEKVSFDLGALGKGYLIDLVMQKLRELSDIKRVLINAGGDIAHWSETKERAKVALENPDDTTQAIGIIEIGNESLASSASNKRRWGDNNQIHHIYNPKLKKSTPDIKATWVTHEQAAIADALATSLFLVMPEKLNEAYPCDFIIITEQGEIDFSQRFENTLFTK